MEFQSDIERIPLEFSKIVGLIKTRNLDNLVSLDFTKQFCAKYDLNVKVIKGQLIFTNNVSLYTIMVTILKTSSILIFTIKT